MGSIRCGGARRLHREKSDHVHWLRDANHVSACTPKVQHGRGHGQHTFCVDVAERSPPDSLWNGVGLGMCMKGQLGDEMHAESGKSAHQDPGDDVEHTESQPIKYKKK